MTPILEIIFSGFVSKVVNDIVDVSGDKIKGAVRNKNTKYQNIESHIYNVLVNVLNKITNNRYENNQDSIYDAVEVLLKSFKENDGDELGSIKSCLRVLDSKVDESECLEFKGLLYEELSKDGYSELFRAILLLLLDQKSRYDNAVYVQLSQKLDEVILMLNLKRDDDENSNIKQKAKSRTQEYADKWETNMFLNDFDKRDKKAGINIKLREVYLDKHLPHYIWRDSDENEPSLDLKELLSEYIDEKRESKMLLILGQPGIGKSTLITWIVANFNNKVNDILVYKFASDLKNIDWENDRVSSRILEELDLKYNDLNGKILILDGFDEVSIENNMRRSILNRLYSDWVYNKTIDNFSLIVTCRENYVQRFTFLKCKYITLQPWDEIQIRSFCKIFQEKSKNSVSESTIKKLLENKEILGIPLILYMVLALNISIEKEGSIVDVYDKIFSLEGGIYDRCIDNKSFAEDHRIGELKTQIHQISREIAIWMFENDPEKANISQDKYKKICGSVVKEKDRNCINIEQDVKIGNFFKSVKHCEGVETEELCFVHRSIYEYFVVETIYKSIESAMIELSEKSQEELARNIAFNLKVGEVSPTISEYLKHKIIKLYNKLNEEKKARFYQWWEMAINKMMNVGMFYYTANNIQNYKDIIAKETRCFVNLMEILRQLADISGYKYIMNYTNRKQLAKYIKYCTIEYEANFNLNKMFLSEINLSGVNLRHIHIENANLSNAVLIDTDLRGAVLVKTDLTRADLNGAFLTRADLKETCLINVDLGGNDLSEVDLRRAKVKGVKLRETKLHRTIFSEEQVSYFKRYYNLSGAMVYVKKNDKVLDYEEFCKGKK